MRCSFLFSGVILACGILSSGTEAQDATVFVQHALKSGEENPILVQSYQLPGGDENVRHAGVPTLIRVPQGGRGCFRIERSNPLLYTYALGSKILKVEKPDTISQLMKQLLALAPKAALPGMGFVAADRISAADTAEKYASAVGQLVRITTEIEAMKLSSDSATDIAAFARRVLVSGSAFADTNYIADDIYESMSEGMKKDMGVRIVRSAQLTQAEKGKRLVKEFEAVEALLEQRLCSAPLAKDRLQLNLSIAPKEGVPASNLRRIVGDAVTSFEVDPVSNTEMDFGPGVIMNTLGRPSKSFALADGKITQGTGEQLLFRPAIMANFRSWGPAWFWGSIGVSGSKDGISDLFVGAAGRFGQQIAGARVSIGIGLAASQLPVGLSKGAVGQPLPEDISSLDKILRKSLVPGLGVVLMATGF